MIGEAKDAEFMCRHLVAFEYDYKTFDEGKVFYEGTNVISGFFIEFHGCWFYTTAGHCFRDLDKKIKKGTVALGSTGFADFYGLDAINKMRVPFSYEPGDAWALDVPEMGFDFGILEVPQLIVMNLKANGIIAISRENWVHQFGLTFDHYTVLGFPVDSEETKGRRRSMMVKLLRVDPSEIEASSELWFAGRIHPALDHLNLDMDRMSGGPIFGFRQNEDGTCTYHVVALQSRWIVPEKKYVLGCSVPEFAEVLYQHFQRQIDEKSGIMPE